MLVPPSLSIPSSFAFHHGQAFAEVCFNLVAHYGSARDFSMIHAILAELRNRSIPISSRCVS